MNLPVVEPRLRLTTARTVIVLVVAMATGLIVGLWLQGEAVKNSDIRATVFEPARSIEAFALTTHLGRPFTLESLQGRWSFLFFGYTYCPDVCPTTLGTMAQVTKQIDDNIDAGQNTQVVFVSIDPQRDTVEQLARYIPYFDQSFIGVTGQQADIDALTRQLGILHLRVEGDDGAGYLMDHTAAILLFNPDAQLRALFSAPHQAEQIVEDFLHISRL